MIGGDVGQGSPIATGGHLVPEGDCDHPSGEGWILDARQRVEDRCLNCDAMLVHSPYGVDRSSGSPEDSPVTHDDDIDLSRDAAQGFAIEAVTQTLGVATDVDTCVKLTARVNSLADEALTYFSQKGVGVACAPGCTFCCHLRVMVQAHEAIALFRYLQDSMPREVAATVRTRVLENAATAGKSPSRQACAFLVDGKCSAYPVRPAACSGYHSLSRQRCEDAHFNTDTAEGIPMSQAFNYAAAALQGGVDQGLGRLGLSAARFELHAAVAALLRKPGTIQRWRSGRTLLREDGSRAVAGSL